MDQKNTRAPEESPQSDASLDTARTTRKFNPWMISTFILAVLLIAMVAASLVGAPSPGFLMPPLSTPTPDTITSPDDTTISKTYIGTVKRGSEVEGAKELCAEGFFIMADEGKYLFDQTKFLLLREPINSIAANDAPTMMDNETYLNHRVRVTGLHNPSAIRCEAMICQCADSIVATNITILDSEEKPQNTTIFTGMLDCLPHRKTSGGQTLECAIGLKTVEGGYYGLRGLNDQDLISDKIAVGNTVTVTGTLLINKMPDKTYDTKGTIEVVAIESILQ